MKTYRTGFPKFVNRIVYTLTEEGVLVQRHGIGGFYEEKIRYDKIGKEPLYSINRSLIAFLGAVLFGGCSALTLFLYIYDGSAESLAWLFWFILAIICLLYFQVTRVEGIKYASDYGSLFIRGKRNRISEFEKELKLEKFKYINNKMDSRLKVADENEVERYLYNLKEGSVLNQHDYDLLKVQFEQSGMEEGKVTKNWLN